MGRPSPQTHGVSQVKCLQLGTGRASFLACSLKVLSKVSSSVISIAGLSTQVSCRIIRLKHSHCQDTAWTDMSALAAFKP